MVRFVQPKLLGLSLIAIAMVFVLFFHGMLRSQMIKMHIEEQMKETLRLESLQLEAAYSSIQQVSDQMIQKQYEELALKNESFVKGIIELLDSRRKISATTEQSNAQDDVSMMLDRLNMNISQRVWVFNGKGEVICCPIQGAEEEQWVRYPELYEEIKIQNDEGVPFYGRFAYLTERPEAVSCYRYYDSEWDWYLVGMASVKSIEMNRFKLEEQSTRKMEDAISQMSIEGTAAVLTEDLVVKYYSYLDLQGLPLMLEESNTKKSISSILVTHKNDFVEYAVLDPKTLRDRTRLAYVHFNADKKLYFLITRNREDLFKSINLQSAMMTQLVGILTVLLFVGNGYLILRQMHKEHTEEA